MHISKAWIASLGLAFTHGAVLMAIFVLSMLSDFEDQLYDNLLVSVTTPDMTQQEMALSVLHATHQLLEPRSQQFQLASYDSVVDRMLRSSDTQLIDAKGNCGSYTHVLARLLQRAGIVVRIAQMKCGDVWGCHILLEAKIDGRFVSLDALYDLAFIKSNGQLASFSEVSQNWEHYQKQAPDDYKNLYAYEDVRYTNWNKIPILMPMAKQVLGVFLGEKIETVSVRSLVLNVYKTYMVALLVLYVLLFGFTAYLIMKRQYRRRLMPSA